MSIIEDGIRLAIVGLVPPKDDASPGRVTGWRWTVAILIGALIMWNFTQFSRTMGWLVFMGFAPYASAQDIQGLKDQQSRLTSSIQMVQNDIRASREGELDTAIQKARADGCHARTDDAKSFASQRLQDKLGQYYALTGHVYFHLPECSEL